MKLLLDENLPGRLKQDFQMIEAFTVREMGWEGIKNGQLLEKMRANGFDVLLTFDKNIQFQQNLDRLGVAVLILDTPGNKYSELRPLVGKVLNALSEPFHGAKTI